MIGLRRARPSSTAGWVALVVVIGVFGFLVRLGLMLRSGALSMGAYDDGVHFTAAVDLVHGRLPYRDVLFLQPPGVALVTSPFAALANLVTDARAFVWARIAFNLVGGLNAALVVLVLRRFGLPAALVGGVLYALSYPAVYTERTITLEAVATTGILLGLILLHRAQVLGAHRWYLLAGAATGSAIGFKIWYVAAFAVLLLWARGGRLRFLLGGAAAGLLIYLPFFIAAPAQMWREVVLAQLGRPESTGTDLLTRLESLLGAIGPHTTSPVEGVPSDTVVFVLLAIVVVCIVAAAFDRRAHVLVALLLVHGAVLLLSPSYFQHYGTLTAAPLALVAGVAVGRAVSAVRLRSVGAIVVVFALAFAFTVNSRHDSSTTGYKEPYHRLRAAVAKVHGCVLADDPTILIVANRLTPDVASGCAVQADPSGAGYVLPNPGSVTVGRREKPAFQAEILRYLWSGRAYMWVRGNGLGLQPATAARLETGTVLFDVGRFVLRETPGR